MEIRVREARHHRGIGLGAVNPYPADKGMGVRAPEHRRVETAGRMEVVHVAPSSSQQTRILAPPDHGSDVLGSHRSDPHFHEACQLPREALEIPVVDRVHAGRPGPDRVLQLVVGEHGLRGGAAELG